MSTSEWIDQFLWNLSTGNFFFISEELPEFDRQAVDKALAFGLAVRDRNSFDITEKGHQVLEAGGFDKWKAAKKRREDEAHQAIIDSAKATVDAAQSSRQSKNAAIISIAVTLVLFAVSYLRDNQSGDKINALEKRLDTLSASMQVQSQTRPAKADSTQNRRKK